MASTPVAPEGVAAGSLSRGPAARWARRGGSRPAGWGSRGLFLLGGQAPLGTLQRLSCRPHFLTAAFGFEGDLPPFRPAVPPPWG